MTGMLMAAEPETGPDRRRSAERRTYPLRGDGEAGSCCAGCGPLVDDASAPEPGQMRVGTFLDRLRAELAATIDNELADIGITSQDCPYLDYWIARYRVRAPAELVEFIRRYAMPSSTTPDAMIAAVRGRVVQGVHAYRHQSGVVPSAAPTKLPAGGGTDAVPSADDALRLGDGVAMDGTIRTRMERSFGTGLGHVRFHTGDEAVEVTGRFGARAVTIGEHLAFAAGELSRPEVERDVLVAHEIAHSLQQRGATEPEAGGALSPSFERDADRSAALVGVRMLLGEDAAVAPAPRLRGGLALGRCAAAAAPAIGVAAGAGTGTGISVGTILTAIGLGAVMTLESDTPRVAEEEEVARVCEMVYPGVRECWTLPDDYVFPGPAAALTKMKADTGDQALALHSPAPAVSGPCPGQGVHYNVRSGGDRAGSITCCPCCSDDAVGPVMTTLCRIVW